MGKGEKVRRVQDYALPGQRVPRGGRIMLAVSQQSTQRPSYRLPSRVHSMFGQSSLEHFARFWIVQHVEHLGCIESLALQSI